MKYETEALKCWKTWICHKFDSRWGYQNTNPV